MAKELIALLDGKKTARVIRDSRGKLTLPTTSNGETFAMPIRFRPRCRLH
jgi:hypothetical protein